jgi:hypothetical protein
MRKSFTRKALLTLRTLSSGDEACRFARVIPACFIALVLSVTEISAGAQSRKRQSSRRTQSEQAEAASQLSQSRDEFLRLTKEYKKSLEQLLTFYEKDAQKAEEQLARLKELYAEGLVSRRNLEEGESKVVEMKAKVAEAQGQMIAADERVAETLVEAQAIEQMAKAPPVLPGKLVKTSSFIRYGGTGAWVLANAWKVQSFFQQRFGRQLPVSAFGQSSLHDRWGLDHRNAMDVGLNPDSIEGQALMAYLRSAGIPFSAFHHAIPGSATGPHIHVGSPSHRFRAPLP